MTVRICFEFRVKPEMLTEYLHRHGPVSEEMLTELHRAGIRHYSIFLSENGRLVGTYETDDPEAADAYLGASEVARDWDRQMRPFFVVDSETGAVSRSLSEVFHLDSQLNTIA